MSFFLGSSLDEERDLMSLVEKGKVGVKHSNSNTSSSSSGSTTSGEDDLHHRVLRHRPDHRVGPYRVPSIDDYSPGSTDSRSNDVSTPLNQPLLSFNFGTQCLGVN